MTLRSALWPLGYLLLVALLLAVIGAAALLGGPLVALLVAFLCVSGLIEGWLDYSRPTSRRKV